MAPLTFDYKKTTKQIWQSSQMSVILVEYSNDDKHSLYRYLFATALLYLLPLLYALRHTILYPQRVHNPSFIASIYYN